MNLIGWCFRKDSDIQICLSDQKNQPIKFFDANDEITTGRDAIWKGRISKLHQGGGFIDTGGTDLFLRRCVGLYRGSEALVQVQTPQIGNKLPRCQQTLMLENHYWRYSRNFGEIQFSPALTRGRDNQQLCLEITQWGKQQQFTNLYLKATAAYGSEEILALEEFWDRIKQQGEKLISQHKNIIGKSKQAMGLIQPPMSALNRALTFPVRKFFAHDRPTTLFIQHEAEKMGVNIPIEYHSETKEYLQEALEIRQCQSHFYKGAEIIIQKTHAIWGLDINSAASYPTNKKPELIALEINHSLVASLFMLIYLKNMHGTIIIDFITMRQKMNREKLLNAMKTEAKRIALLLQQPPLILHGFTRSGLFEIQTY